MNYQYNFLDEIIIDSFAGGGGASTGIELATGRIVDIAINHDRRAIEMHEMNHPFTKHYCENVFEVDPKKAVAGRKVGLFWLSPDCTHFSKAKGGKPVKKEIRGLAWIAVKWAEEVRPRVIMLENVEEFMTWGPIDDNGQPIKEYRGETFNEFVAKLRKLGYEVDWRILRACDYGAPTTRKRFFLIARCDGQPIIWPAQTHGKAKGLKPYRTAAEIIDWSIPVKSIFDRIKPLSEATMRRIARGLKKFVFDNPKPFIVQVNHSCLITPIVASTHFSNTGDSAATPLSTVTAVNNHELITPVLIQMGYGENKEQNQKPRCLDLDKPLGTIPAGGNKFALCQAFITKYFGGNYTGAGSSPSEPLHTVTAQDHNAIVAASFISRQFGTSTGHKVDEPLGAVTHVDKSRLVKAFLIKYFNGNDNAQSLDEPFHTIRTHDSFGLVTIEGIDYQIIDIGMRMLEPRELFNAQGFPPDYKIEFDVNGKRYPKSEQVARCGNSVCPQVVTALVKANLPELSAKRPLQTMAELQKALCAGL